MMMMNSTNVRYASKYFMTTMTTRFTKGNCKTFMTSMSTQHQRPLFLLAATRGSRPRCSMASFMPCTTRTLASSATSRGLLIRGSPLWKQPQQSHLIGNNIYSKRSTTSSNSSSSTSTQSSSSKVPRMIGGGGGGGVEKVLRVIPKKQVTDAAAANSTATASNSNNKTMSFLQRFLEHKEMPPRHTFAWYREMILICTVFAITGSSTMVLVRPAVKDGLGIQGTMRDGPWSYRLCSIIIMSPIYATLLVVVGTLFGRHAYFRHFSVKIFSRFGFPPELMDKNWQVHKNNFRKW